MVQANINPAIAHLAVPVGTLTHYDGNARKHDLPTIAASLKANGQYRPIVVRKSDDPHKDNVVLAGNGTLAAARLLEWDVIAASPVECDDDRARRIVLIDNRANDLSGYDDELLATLLQELDGNYEGTGYEEDDLTDLLDELAKGPDGGGDGGGMSGQPVISYQLIFDDEAQQNRWYEFLRKLRNTYPDAESIAARVLLYLADHPVD